MTIKQKILGKALHLFNTEGVEKITTRHIAKPLKISQGNLHYHYPNKNEIILALFQQFLVTIENSARNNPGSFFLKEEVFESIKENFKVMYTYRFLFKDNEVVWRRLPQIKEDTMLLFEKKKNGIKQIIAEYKFQKIFRPSISDEQIDYLSEQFLFSITSWLTASAYTTEEEDVIAYFSKFTFRLWLPYLTETEMKKWEAILGNKYK